MRRALVLARRGAGRTAPNPMVGAVIVREGRIVAEGFHERLGGPHAEAAALAVARDLARGSDMFVTLEPCNHQGKTPPCVDALIKAGVRRVVAAVRDPGGGSGRGAERLCAAGILVEFGLGDVQARELNAPFFFHASGATRPWVTLKLALSLEGTIADESRRQRTLSGVESLRYVHRLRAASDAIGVGIGTALADDPLLTVRYGRRAPIAPLRVVFDRGARLSHTSRLAKSARSVRTIVMAEHPPSNRASELEEVGVIVERTNGLADALQVLQRRGVQSLLIEGGATLAGAMLAAGLVDRLIIFQTPVLLGARGLPAFGGISRVDRLRLLEHRAFGDDLMSVYALRDLPSAP